MKIINLILGVIAASIIAALTSVMVHKLLAKGAPKPQPSPPPEFLTPTIAQPTPTPEPTPAIELPPEPAELWAPYILDTEGHIKHPKDECKYVMPDNEVVQYYAKRTFVDGDGYFKWNNYNLFVCHFAGDVKYPTGDYWYNPDYFLTHGNIGDCEDFALALVSLLLAKGIPAILVAGYWETGTTHIGAEYVYNNIVRYADTTGYYERKAVVEFNLFTPTRMFNDQITWREYEKDWYKYYRVET